MDWPCYKNILMSDFYAELQEGKRSQGGRKKRYKDTLESPLKDFEIPTAQSGEVSSTNEQLFMKEREYVKLKESTGNAKPRPICHQLIP